MSPADERGAAWMLSLLLAGCGGDTGTAGTGGAAGGAAGHAPDGAGASAQRGGTGGKAGGGGNGNTAGNANSAGGAGTTAAGASGGATAGAAGAGGAANVAATVVYADPAAPTNGGISDVAVLGDWVYFTQFFNTLYRVKKTGGTRETVAVEDGYLLGLRSDGSSLFWAIFKAGGAIRTLDPASTTPRTVFVTPPEDIPTSALPLAGDPWLTVALAKTQNVKRVRRDGTDYGEIAAKQGLVVSLARTVSEIVWASWPLPGDPEPTKGSIRSFSQTNGEIATVAADRPLPLSLSPVGSVLWWVESQSSGDRVSQMQTPGGIASTLPGTGNARALVADAQGLAWTTPTHIVVSMLDGSVRVETPWTVVGTEEKCALDASFVYCGDGNANVIVRVPR